MKKLLYITDQDEYIDHSFIAPLFEIYLKKYIEIDILYFSDFKSDFSYRDRHRFVMPSCDKSTLIQTLELHDILMSDYDFVMVRNDINLMKDILTQREKYGYKALYRFSYPKASFELYADQVKKANTFFAPFRHHFKMQNKTAIINECDAFLPTSQRMHDTFLPHVTIPSIICPPAINPRMIQENTQHDEDEKRFFYTGTLDKTRQFEIILDAFQQVKDKRWKLFIATKYMSYVENMLSVYPSLASHIHIYKAKTKEEVLNGIATTDIGIALLPNIPVYNSSLPVKIFDYYASGVPCLMTHSPHTDSVFSDCETAWFCDFSVDEIAKKIEYLIIQSKEEVMEVGSQGQAYLLSSRNYENIAQNIAKALEEIE
jgi:glycosyltransferase involved in cell wall biosynthesis